jgi:hypothetical protein
VGDSSVTTPIQESLDIRNLSPAEHWVDTGYTSAEALQKSREVFGINLIGPTRLDTSWQAKQTRKGFAAGDFMVNWDKKQATCPAGKPASTGNPPRMCAEIM